MTAQYMPYRDEEGLDSDHINWREQEETGTVQIYEKTSDDIRVVSNKNLVMGAIALALLGSFVGLLIGFFAHTQHSECVPGLAVALHSVRDENPTIRKKILEAVNPEHIRQNIKTFSSRQHLAGSEADDDLAEIIIKLFNDYKLDKVEKSSYDVLLSYPDCKHPNYWAIVNTNGSTYLNNSKDYCATTSYYQPYAAYSPKMNITGEVVYVHYGHWSDLVHLQNVSNINLEGKILLARQPKSAYELAWNAHSVKAAGLLLYPDPKEYNPPLTSNYPSRWWLPPDAVKSDSVLWNGVGDPLTPGYPSKDYANRLSEKSAFLPSIPIQPISADDAYQILSLMGGPPSQDNWKGGFNLSYNIGPGFTDNTQQLYLEVNNVLVNKTVHNVLGYIKGKVEPDRYVLVGSHRDAWMLGAVDSASGTAAMLELARVFGELLQKGWRPRRTIVFCNWAAERFNLIGSTEWIEEKGKILHERAVAYISTDEPVIGNDSISVVSSPLLYSAIFNATKEVANPNTEEVDSGMITLFDQWLKTFHTTRNISELLFPEFAHGDSSFLNYDDHYTPISPEAEDLLQKFKIDSMAVTRPKFRELDSKENYAPFFLRSGIPAVQINYVHDAHDILIDYPLQHTQYDNFNFMEQFIDPNFKFHVAAVQVLGELLRDIADSLFLPINLFEYAQTLRNLYNNLYTNAATLLKDQDIILSHLDSAISNFTKAANKFHTTQTKLDMTDPMAIRRINDQLLLIERAFLDPNGLTQEPLKWHSIMSLSDYHYSHMGMGAVFPGILDEVISLKLHQNDNTTTWDTIRSVYSSLVATINSATNVISDVV